MMILAVGLGVSDEQASVCVYVCVSVCISVCGHSLGIYPETGSYATCQETLGHSRPSSLGHCGLIVA